MRTITLPRTFEGPVFLNWAEGLLEKLEPMSPGTAAGYAPWIDELAVRSGVYFIFSRRSEELLYIGESHTGRLKRTIGRHFQSWDTTHRDAVYGRGDVLIAVVDTPPATAIDLQYALIAVLAPRDNEVGQRDDDDSDEEAPF